MYTKIGTPLWVAGWALTLAGGCDDQVSPGYFGESLLTVMGSVAIADSRFPAALTPALGFSNGPAITIVDVPVRGTFPSDFRIELYEQPPESTLYHPTEQEEGEPLAAIGYITAVPRDHPEKLYTGNSLSIMAFSTCKDEGRADKLCLTQIEELCPAPNPDKIPCYAEKRYCPTQDADPKLCVVETSGDKALKEFDVLDHLAGFSQNYQVVYLAQEARRGSATAALLEAEQGVPAGYGLYEVHFLTGDEEERCFSTASRSWELAIQYYNEAHGTDYKSLECEKEPDAPFCTMPSEDSELRTGPQGEVNRLLEKARMEIGCPIHRQHYKRVGDPENTPISILIDKTRPSQRATTPPTQP